MPADTALFDDQTPRPARNAILGAIVILAITLAAYWPAMSNGGFIWDDDSYVTDNVFLTQGVDGLMRMWQLHQTPQYYPVVFTTFWTEYQLWELNPTGYHVVSVLLHAINALLVWVLARRLKIPWPWLIGAIFALHPVHVESVAWITERKNTLSALFYLLAALAYLQFDEDRNSAGKRVLMSDSRSNPWAWYVASLICFVLALLSKSVTCSLPAALILMMLWQRKPLTVPRLAPLVPFFVVGLLLALNTAQVERDHVGATGEAFDFSFADRALIASKALLFYPWKIIWPWPVIFIYPRWEIDDAQLWQYWSVIAVIAVAIGAIVLYMRGRRGPALALAFFAGTIFPALGFVNVYPMMFSFVADHFQYLASLGVIALIVGALAAVLKSPKRMPLLAIVILTPLGLITYAQCMAYESVETIFRDTLAKNDRAFMACNNLASDLIRRSRDTEAARDTAATQALRGEAMTLLQQAIAIKPRYPQALSNISALLFLAGKYEEALPYAQQSLDLITEMETVREALKKLPRPQHPPIGESFADVAQVQAALKQNDEAKKNYQEAIRWNERDITLLSEYAAFLLSINDRDEAAAVLGRMLQVTPDDPRLLGSAAEVARERGRFLEAEQLFDRAVSAAEPRSPDQTRWLVRKALMLSSCPDAGVRDTKQAVAIMESLVQRSQRRDPSLLDVLANVLADDGRLPDAVRVAEEAASLAERLQAPDLAKQIRERVNQYRIRMQPPTPLAPVGPTTSPR